MSLVLRTPTLDMVIDVVDVADRKIGETERADVLSQAVNFHTVHLFLFDPAGRLLLQQLGANRDRNPLKWGASVAAYLFAGEPYEDGIRRRAFQELGIRINPDHVGKIEMVDEKSTKFVSLFRATYDGDVTPDPQHIETVRFASLMSFRRWLPSRNASRQLSANYFPSIYARCDAGAGARSSRSCRYGSG
jgi:isopentenyl-diphosphate delta-isomerase